MASRRPTDQLTDQLASASANVNVSFLDKLAWQTVTLKKKFGVLPKLDENGVHIMKGKLKQYKADLRDVEFQIPTLAPVEPTASADISTATQALAKHVRTLGQLVALCEAVLEAECPGYATEAAIVEHLTWGLINDPVRQIRSGQEIRLTQAQREVLDNMVNTYQGGYLIGALTGVDTKADLFEWCVSICERQGVPDARREFQTRIDAHDANTTPEESSEGTQ